MMPTSGRAAALEAWRKKVQGELKKADEAFKGDYAVELNQLLGLSSDEIDRITPDTTDLQVYHQLITVVEEASRQNIQQAMLRSQIEALGQTAVEIAKKAPKLAELFV
jgi:hypothetical protein